MLPPIPRSWRPHLAEEIGKPYFAELADFVANEQARHEVYPPADHIFSALELTAYEDVSVLILGQDPYHGPGQAHGLSFSVLPGTRTPASLRNIYKELQSDLGCTIPNNGYLAPWAEQGVLLLNAVLTVRAGEPNSHRNKGWEQFTDAIIRAVGGAHRPVVFVLWGAYALKKSALIDASRHTVVKSVHPSPLSASSGFFGSRPFSKVNRALHAAGRTEIAWQIPDLPRGART
ncbi:MAG: uracil-DNA glycosylase [Gemmatimonadaceae bacterium]